MNAGDGVRYFFHGFSLIKTKGLKRFVFVPLVINLLLFGAAFFYLIGQIDSQIEWVRSQIPTWLSWIEFLLFPLALVIILLVFSLLFSSVANWLAAPFNGVLAERVEQHLSGETPPNDSLMALIKALPHTLLREWKKLLYFVPRFIAFLLIGWFFPIVGQVIWFLFIAWVLAVQYCDYAFDNNKYKFDYMRHILRQNRGACFGFGSAVSIFTMIPLINMIVMPVAICGATAMWVERLRPQAVEQGSV